MRKGATTRRETSRDDDDDDDDILRRFDGRFSPALGLFEALEKDPAEKKKKKKKKEKGCDIIVASIAVQKMEASTPTSRAMISSADGAGNPSEGAPARNQSIASSEDTSPRVSSSARARTVRPSCSS